MPLADLLADVEHAIRLARQLALQLRHAGLDAPAAALEQMAHRLEDDLKDAIIPNEDKTPPAGAYVDKLLEGLADPRAYLTEPAIRWLQRRFREGRLLVRKLNDALELFGTDVELTAAANRWLDRIEAGPGGNDDTQASSE